MGEVETILAAYKDRVCFYNEILDRILEGFSPLQRGSKSVRSDAVFVKGRVKTPESLLDKLKRKQKRGETFNTLDDIHNQITDLIGIRVVTLSFHDFKKIDKFIEGLNGEEFVRNPEDEKPFIRSWDPQIGERIREVDLDLELDDSRGRYYTSIHYLFRVNQNSPLRIEIQVRTLLEEVWGEVDHYVNYPHRTEDHSVRLQLAALSKICSAGNDLIQNILVD